MIKNRLAQDKSTYELIMVEDPFFSEDSLNLASQMPSLILAYEHAEAGLQQKLAAMIQPYLVFINSNGSPEALRQVYLAGYNSVMTKPIFKEALKILLIKAKLLEKR